MAYEIQTSAATGLTLNAQLVQGNAAVGAVIALAELGAVPGMYVGSVPGGTAAGVYSVAVLSAGKTISLGQLRWNGASEDLAATAAALATLQTAASAIKAKTDALPAAPAAQSDVTTVGTAVATLQTTATAIKGKTDNLPADPASQTNVTAIGTAVSALGTLATGIKAKTDNLPGVPAAQSDVPSAATVAAAVHTDLQGGTPIPVAVTKVLGKALAGSGTTADPFHVV